MKQRPVYRWKSFWLGVLVMACLGWAWVNSMGRLSGVGWQWNGGGYDAGQGNGEVYVEWGIYDPSSEDVVNQWSFEMEGVRTWFPKGVTREAELVAVAYWLLMLAFFLPWSLWMGWRWWRMRRNPLGRGGAEDDRKMM